LYCLFLTKSIQDCQDQFVYSHIDFVDIIDIDFEQAVEAIAAILESLLVMVRQNQVCFDFKIMAEPFKHGMDSSHINYSHKYFKFHSLACQL